MKLDSVQMLLPFLSDIIEKNKFSELLAKYLDCYLSELTLEEYEEKRQNFLYGYMNNAAERVGNCGRYMFFDVAEKQKVKIFQNLILCKNRFCLNCQKQRQLTRLFRFGPRLDETAETCDLYHMVLTVPNCCGEVLSVELANLHASFTKLISMFLVCNNRKRKAREEFKYLGCVAALRNSEITFDKSKRKKGEEYHAHIHCILALRQGLELPKIFVHEKFSYDFKKGKKLVRYFCKLELKLQRIWYLLINGYRYSKKNYEEIKGEYSVILDKIDSNSYYEVFKYSTKFYDENSNIMDYEEFSVLKKALKGRRTMQGYGDWYNISNEDEIEEGSHKVEQIVVAYLNKTEELERTINSVYEVKSDMLENLEYFYLNMKLIHNIGNDELDRIINLASTAEFSTMIKELKLKKIEQDKDSLVERFKYVYHKCRGRSPSAVEVDIYRNNLFVDERGRVRVLRSAKQLTFWGEEEILNKGI